MQYNMQDNYNMLIKRVLDTLDKTDLQKIKKQLAKIKENTICTGVGGSKVVSDYASSILNSKNNISSISCEPQEINFLNLKPYQNVLTCSYSGTNYGVEMSFSNTLNKYLLSHNKISNVNNLTYYSSYQDEHSFISLAATLMPMSILLAYYLDNDFQIIKEILNQTKTYHVEPNNVFEIISASYPKAAETFLESTMTESGIAIPILHGKYGYCHGRSTIAKDNKHSLILMNQNTTLDNLLLTELPQYFKQIIEIKSRYQDPIIDDYYRTYQAMLLTKEIAKINHKDLSEVDYLPIVKKLYKFKGSM